MDNETQSQAELRKTVAEADLAEQQRRELGRSFFKKPAFLGPLVPAGLLVFGVLKFALSWDTLEAERLAQEARQDRLETGNMLLEQKNGLLEGIEKDLRERIKILSERERALGARVHEWKVNAGVMFSAVSKHQAVVTTAPSGALEGAREAYLEAMHVFRGDVETFSKSLPEGPVLSPDVIERTRRQMIDLDQVNKKLNELERIREFERNDGTVRRHDDGQ